TADDQARPYGLANPVLTGTIIGIQNNDALTESFSTPATIGSPIGGYPIVPSVVGAMLTNYSLTSNNGTLTVASASLLVKANDQARGYGATNGPLTVTYSGFGNGQDTNI